MTHTFLRARSRLSALIIGSFIALALATPAQAAGSSMPWEAPLQAILESIQGPVAKIVAVIIIIATGLALAFGTTSGAYSTGVMFASDPVDDATADSNLGDGWEHIQAGANGMRMGQSYSAGLALAPYFILTWTDDLDALAAASANSFGDPKVQANMVNSNTKMVGRMTSRTLG